MSFSVLFFAGAVIIALVIFTLREIEKRPPPKHEVNSADSNPAPQVICQETCPSADTTPAAPTRVTEDSFTSPVLARWTIRYRSGDGATTRTVRITRVHPRKHQIVGWCELRNQERTFSLFAIEEARDASTGERLDLNEWMTAYRRSRRNKNNTKNN